MDSADVCALVRRDHDGIDRAFAAMVDPATPPKELSNLLDVLQLALAVHTAAEARVMELLLARTSGPQALSMLVTQTRLEHVAQRAGVDALARIRPESIAWYEYALELRVLVLDHAGRAEQWRWTFEDHVPFGLQRQLGSEYATERMRVLASTSPIAMTQRRDAALAPN
jgi:hypothetical protein